MDERLAAIEKQKQDALNKSNQTYGGMLQNNEDLYNQQKNYADEYERSQNDALDKQLAFQEQLINQQKETARQNMETESKKAKNDYFSYINPYGLQAESLASRGLLNSGVSETAKLGGYNTYQNRLATANKVMQDAFVQYDNDINQARLTNDVQKAQNALKRLEMQLQYSENYYNQKNSITQNQLANNQSLDSEYYNRYNTEYNNIQEEKAREEAIRQWEAEMAEKQRQYNENLAYQNRQLAEQQRQYNEQMAYQKAQDALAQQNWEKEYALAKKTSSSSKKSSSSGSKTILTNGNGTKLNNGNSSISANGLTIIANPYTGKVNQDAKYGVFESGTKGSGYQPNNVGGKAVSKTGIRVRDIFGESAVGSTGISLSNQSVWTTGDKYYVWDGTINDYIDITDQFHYYKKYGKQRW